MKFRTHRRLRSALLAFVCIAGVPILIFSCRKRQKVRPTKQAEPTKLVVRKPVISTVPDDDFMGIGLTYSPSPSPSLTVSQSPKRIQAPSPFASPMPTPQSTSVVAKTEVLSSPQPSVGKQRLFVKAIKLHIRMRPDRHSLSVGFKYGGDVVDVMIDGDWAKLEDGKWLRTRWLASEKPKELLNPKDL